MKPRIFKDSDMWCVHNTNKNLFYWFTNQKSAFVTAKLIWRLQCIQPSI